jgi:quinol monooxygenase YgiN
LGFPDGLQRALKLLVGDRELTALRSHSSRTHSRIKDAIMVKVALLVRLEAKPGKEAAVAQFLEGALPLANQEAATPVWFALRLGPTTFGIFDAFADDTGRKAHLAGPIAAALMKNAAELLAKPPVIEQVDVLAVKLKH